jgi:TrmH family RNA methyltransferase
VRDPGARREQGAFVLEGPRVVEAALDRDVSPETVYLAPGADRAFAPLLERVRAAGIATVQLKEGVLERISATVTPQPILAVASRVAQPLDRLPHDGVVLVLVSVQDPGNAGTLIRSAEASGAAAVVCCGNSVDLHSPKVVRSSAGAIFGLAIAEGDDPVEVLAALGAQGRRRIGTAAAGGDAPDQVDLTGPIALVLGNEARGLTPDLSEHLEAEVTVPVSGPAVDSLNVAMAGTVLCFEAARQRRKRP